MFGYVLREWFSDWRGIDLHYDEVWPLAPFVSVLALGVGGAAVMAWASFAAPELFGAAIHPVAFALTLPAVVLLGKWWFSDGARHLPFVVLAHLAAAMGMAVLIGRTGLIPPADVASWITCSGLVTSLATPALGRAWTLFGFYIDLQHSQHTRIERARAARAATHRAGADLLVEVRDVGVDAVDLVLLDASGERPAVASRELFLGKSGGFFLLEGATLAEVQVAAAGTYRGTTRALRLTARAAAHYMGRHRPDFVLSWTPEILVSSGMLLAHQLVLWGAAWILARAGALS